MSDLSQPLQLLCRHLILQKHASTCVLVIIMAPEEKPKYRRRLMLRMRRSSSLCPDHGLNLI